MKADDVSKIETLCHGYVAALERGDLDALLQLFTHDATARSPISGLQPARDLYANVLRITSARRVDLNDVFLTAHAPPKAAVHVSYTRTVEGHAPAVLDAVDIFEITPDLAHFKAVTIIYDTAPTRADFE